MRMMKFIYKKMWRFNFTWRLMLFLTLVQLDDYINNLNLKNFQWIFNNKIPYNQKQWYKKPHETSVAKTTLNKTNALQKKET